MTDDIFLTYGGQTGTSTDIQRQIAYGLAEEQMTEYLSTFLIPTTTTGTYFYRGGNPFSLEYGWVSQVHQVTISSIDGNNSCAIDTATGCSAIRGDGRYGIIDIAYLASCGGCGSIFGLPYNVQVSYESGLQTGTSHQPPMLQALTLAAQVNLNEIDISLSNEGTADIGIQQFTNQKYSEVRAKLGNTQFGNSAVTQRIARLVRKYKTKPTIGMH